jgi:organic hydroperoxide reductase OsmC/OhrA
VYLSGGPSGHAQVATAGVPVLPTAPPVEYGGPGDAWTPEHLFLAAVQSCFLFTLRAVARASKMEFSTLELDAVGTVDRRDGATRFTEIVLRPRLAVASATPRERVLHVLQKTEKACLVSASLSTPVRVEPAIEEPHLPASLTAMNGERP